MLTVAIGQRVGKDGDEDVWPKGSDDRNDVGDERIARPTLERQLTVLRNAEVERASEERDAAVDATRRERLLRANRAQRDPAFIADEVVAGLSSRQREVARLDHAAAREPGNELRVVVVGVGTDDQHARRDGEAVDEPMQLRGASILRGKSRHDRERE